MLDLIIKTERLTLRPFRADDGPIAEQLAGDWEVARMTSRIPHPYPVGAAQTWIATHEAGRKAGTTYPFAVTSEGQLVGCVSLDGLDEKKSWDDRVSDPDAGLELGYWFGAPFWGRGFAAEATAAVVEFAFHWLAKTYLVAGYFRGNEASGRVLEKLGFTAAGQTTIHSLARGQDVECVLMAPLTRDTWAKKSV